MNNFQKFQPGMTVVPRSTEAVGLKGVRIARGAPLIIEHVFDCDGNPHFNFPRIRDAFPAEQFEECADEAVLS